MDQAKARLLLLWKTKVLELKQKVSGLPAEFTLTGDRLLWWTWGQWHKAAKITFWINLGVVALHSGRFLLKKVHV